MPTRLTSSDTPQADGPARYRTTGHGRHILVPARCPDGLHQLAVTGYRITESNQLLYVDCDACYAQVHPNSAWTLTTDGRPAESAEFDDKPYAHLARAAARPEGFDAG